jgi:hypothetical protein
MLDETAYPIAARVGSAAGAAHGSAYSPGYAYTRTNGKALAPSTIEGARDTS